MRSASQTNAEPLRLTRLRFDEPEAEAAFARYHVSHSLAFARGALVLAIVLYAAFGLLDRLVVPEVAGTIWAIRFAVVCPIAAGVLAASYTGWFRRHMQPVLAVYGAVLGLGIVAMIAVSDTADGHYYYAGLLLVIPYVYTFVQLRFAWATAAVVVIIAAYEAVAIWIKATPAVILINNNFFFLSSVVIGMAAGYTIERGVRLEFSQRRIIEAQRAELADHNERLDAALQVSLEEVRRQADELRASRVRIVSASDEARRRIERDLHDGAQQRLVGLAVKVRVAERALEPGDGPIRSLLGELTADLQEATEELRTLAHGIYPPVLADEGLGAALSAAAARASIEVTVEAPPERYLPEVEAAVYFCALEALQNASKYAGEGARARVVVQREGDTLRFEVADDGQGFDASAVRAGAGFTNMSDRLGTLGGSLSVASAPGRATTITGTLVVTESSISEVAP